MKKLITLMVLLNIGCAHEQLTGTGYYDHSETCKAYDSKSELRYLNDLMPGDDVLNVNEYIFNAFSSSAYIQFVEKGKCIRQYDLNDYRFSTTGSCHKFVVETDCVNNKVLSRPQIESSQD